MSPGFTYCRGFEVGLGWIWRESTACNLLIAQRLSVDYPLSRCSNSAKRPSTCDTGAPCWDASCAAVVEQSLCLVGVRVRSVFRQLHAGGRASYASSYAGRCELCVQQWCGWVRGYARLSFERRRVVH
jgi:hypothetical protein